MDLLMGEFPTAVRHKLPVKVVVFNTLAFGLSPLEAESRHGRSLVLAVEIETDYASLIRPPS